MVRPSLSKEGLNLQQQMNNLYKLGFGITQRKKLEPHYHNDFERKANITSGTVFVSKGRILLKYIKKIKN